MTNTKAEELAASIEKRRKDKYAYSDGYMRCVGCEPDPECQEAAAELRRLAVVEAEHQRREAMFKEGIDAVTAVAMQAQDKANRLAAEVEALRADKERLDHLQETGSTVSVVHPFSKPYRLMVGGLHSSVNTDIRAAIDASRGKG